MSEVVNITVERQVQQVSVTVLKGATASPEQVNEGEETQRYITPRVMAGSLYRRIHIQATQPEDPKEGDLWIKASF